MRLGRQHAMTYNTRLNCIESLTVIENEREKKMMTTMLMKKEETMGKILNQSSFLSIFRREIHVLFITLQCSFSWRMLFCFVLFFRFLDFNHFICGRTIQCIVSHSPQQI